MQNYKNHLRLYPAHHFVLIPANLALLVWSFIHLFDANASLQERIIWVLTSFTIFLLSMITRIYALKNQDRLIRLEMRQRYFELTGKSFAEKENQLKLGQIIALRFASNEELLALMDRAINEKLSNKDIKLAIKNWKEDNHRI
ncbi:MAG: hypothetical protein FGM14_02145 [Flavobacteriales bacterium]|nr:hypothetical protein [Flavobacteriales bacterium]